MLTSTVQRPSDLQRAEEFWLTLAREDSLTGTLAFIYFVFGFKPEPFHVDWLRQLLYHDIPNQTIVAPRGSAKTTYLCMALLKYIADHPWDANGLLSVSTTQVRERIAFIRSAINSERFQKVYPWIQIDEHRPDTQTQFSVWDTRYDYKKWRSSITRLGGDFKSPTLTGAGTGGRGITGSRITGILAFDDVSDQDNARTGELREQLWRWLTDTVFPILSGNHHRIWNIGTRWADGDAVSRSIATGVFNHSEIKIFHHIGDRLRSYWPKEWSFKKIIQRLNEVGKTSFLLSYLNNIVGLSGAIFTADMLRTDYPRDERGVPVFPEFDSIIISVDAGILGREADDDSAIAAVGIRTSPNTSLPQLWILRMDVGPMGDMEVLTNLERMWHNVTHNFNAADFSVLFETVAGQQLFLTIMDLKPDFTIPKHLVDTYTPVTDKGARARSTAACGERGDLILDMSAEWYPKLFSQYVEFTGERGNADDMVDVITQVAQREIGDIGGYVVFNATYTRAVVPGLTL